MSAVSNYTYIYIRDNAGGGIQPTGDTMFSFANYTEAMSWCKSNVKEVASSGEIFVWNYNGGSGNWRMVAGIETFFPVPNNNWP